MNREFNCLELNIFTFYKAEDLFKNGYSYDGIIVDGLLSFSDETNNYYFVKEGLDLLLYKVYKKEE